MNRIATLLMALVVVSGCLTVASARESGAARVCDYEQRCGNIGSGQRFASRADCLTNKRSDFLTLWPTEKCDGRIDAQRLDVCFTSIETKTCGSLLDFFESLSKCTAAEVCIAQ